MKQQLDNLIINTLLDEREVYLPGVGTLILVRNTAKLLTKTKLQAPYNELRLTKENRGSSITMHISSIAQVSEERAFDIYNEWLALSLRNDILTINGLCTIENGEIETDKSFEDMANPNGRGVVKIKPRTNYFLYTIATLCILFALGIAGYVLYTNNTFNKTSIKSNIPQASEAFERTSAQNSEEVSKIVEAPQVAETTEATKEVEQPVVESYDGPAILPMQKGCSYAVWGVYNELENAEKAKAWLATRFPELEADIYQYDERYMVALCELSSRSECGRKVSAWRAEHKSFKNVWVYTR